MSEHGIRLGISACLLGRAVRYDGGHREDRFITDILGRCVDLVPVCPEEEAGLGVPREPMRLVGDPDQPRLLTIRSGLDLTEMMLAWSLGRVRELEKDGLCGFIFKSRSPSCGMAMVPVYGKGDRAAATGAGLFARAFMEYCPVLPVTDEVRLRDSLMRNNFMEQIFVHTYPPTCTALTGPSSSSPCACRNGAGIIPEENQRV